MIGRSNLESSFHQSSSSFANNFTLNIEMDVHAQTLLHPLKSILYDSHNPISLPFLPNYNFKLKIYTIDSHVMLQSSFNLCLLQKCSFHVRLCLFT